MRRVFIYRHDRLAKHYEMRFNSVMSTETKTHFLRKDLLRIAGLTLVLFVIVGAVLYIDATQNVIGTWAEQFYSFVLNL